MAEKSYGLRRDGISIGDEELYDPYDIVGGLVAVESVL
jgi:hypothetical protein